MIYKIDGDSVYIVTYYHVVYNAAADEDKNGGSKIGCEIYCYLYGSESMPVISGYDDDDYYQYEYGDYAIECEYIGGSQETDIAVLRAEKEAVYAVNDNVRAVTLAEDYHVGESVYAIGNAEGEGITATEGIVSLDNEYIGLDIDENGTDESYRSIRFDTSIYHGNSGGGLFNARGELIGITNAGIDGYESICYAIPVSIAKGAAEISSIILPTETNRQTAYIQSNWALTFQRKIRSMCLMADTARSSRKFISKPLRKVPSRKR